MAAKVCFQFADFKDNINASFESLRKNDDFADVTLACEDGQQIEAHKVILAASSTFFENLLRKNRHVHPLIYLRGVTLNNLVAIVDFLYFGETSIWKENLESFLNIAEDFKLKGLTSENEAKENEMSQQKVLSQKIFSLKINPKLSPKSSKRKDLNIATSPQALALTPWQCRLTLRRSFWNMTKRSGR